MRTDRRTFGPDDGRKPPHQPAATARSDNGRRPVFIPAPEPQSQSPKGTNDMTTEELEAAFITALNEAGVKASPEEARLAAHVFAREIETGSAYRRAKRKATAEAVAVVVAAVAAVAGIVYLVF